MTYDPITVSPKASLKEVKDIMEKKKIHHLPVLENGRLAGIISKSDLLLFMKKKFVAYDDIVEKSRLNAFHVEDIMTTGIARLSPEDHIATALNLFKENIFHAVPIEKEGRLVGIVTTFDIIDNLLKEAQPSE